MPPSMANLTFILCPGQGAQQVGMGKDFYEKSPAAKAMFDRANGVLGWDLSAVCFGGPEDRLNQTDVSQPAIYVTSLASFAAAQEAGKLTNEGAGVSVAGLSLGEYTALHLAGVFDFETGLKLVAARGKYMQEAAVATPSGMVAVLGADEAQAVALCEEAAGGEVLVPANFNAPGQIVISGSAAACERALSVAAAKGMKTVALKVAGAFHSPIMQSGADRMAAELEKAGFNAPRGTVYSNVTAQPHTDVASIKRLLVEQIVRPVRWEQTMQHLIATAPDGRYVELAPQRQLAGMIERINRRLPVESFATVS